jgi:hypothetical protein
VPLFFFLHPHPAGRVLRASSEIHDVFDALEEVSMETIQRLDAAYYGILERSAATASAVRGLQDLAEKRGALLAGFGADAAEVEREAQERIDAFGGFDGQIGKLEALQGRLRDSKDRTDGLSQRLEAARERVRTFESLEAEVQASISCELIGTSSSGIF